MARLLVWLSVLLSVLYSQGTGTCPVQCRCWKTTCNGALVYCYYRGLHGLPTNIPTDTCILNLGLNDITLHYGIFDTLVNLRELYLENNELTWLPYGVFGALVNLQGLNLANNQITTLPNGIFDALPNLQRLKLDRNEIVTLPNGIFDALTNLQQLYLEYNQITTIQKATFGGLVNVTIYRAHDWYDRSTGDTYSYYARDPTSNSTVRTDARSTRIEIFTIAEDTHTTRPGIDTTSARSDSNITGTRSVTGVTKLTVPKMITPDRPTTIPITTFTIIALSLGLVVAMVTAVGIGIAFCRRQWWKPEYERPHPAPDNNMIPINVYDAINAAGDDDTCLEVNPSEEVQYNDTYAPPYLYLVP